VATDHPNYNKIIEKIKANDFDGIENLVNVAKAVVQYASGRIKIENGEIFYSGFAVHNTLTNRIITMMNEGFKFDHMIKFLENLMQNSSARAVDETYWFLENYGLPITDDGCFLAYKAVRSDYTDIYSGKFSNLVGAVVSMPRNQVDDNYGKDCSKGLHVGALDYVIGYGHFTKGEPVPVGGNRLLLVKVNPKDVVSVPKYEGHTKMRVCEYVVVNEIKDVVKELDKVVYTSTAQDLNPDYNGCDIPEDYQDDCCEDGCSCDSDSNESEKVAEIEYNAGYEQGSWDRQKNLGFTANLNIDATVEFTHGYEDGYDGL
jgi:hypothetical protein